MLRFATAAMMAFGIAVFGGTAAGAQPPKDFTACAAAAKGVAFEPIHFATDRPRLADENGHMVFGGDRPDFHGLVGFDRFPYATDHTITYGVLDEHGDPQPDPAGAGAFAAAPAQAKLETFTSRVVEAAARRDAALVVYVHGYNTTFQGAVTAAQTLRLGLSCATNFQRKIVVLFFAWPSAAKLLKPSDDEVRAEWAYRDFKNVMDGVYLGLLVKILEGAPASTPPFAVAHSMGNRFLLHEIDRCLPKQQCFSRVAFVAPDVDSRFFADVMALHPDATEHATVYASARDKVLWASQFFHGEARAGEGGSEFLRFNSAKIDTVDAAYMQAETLCHSYIDRPVMLFDIAKMFFGPIVPDAPTRYPAQRDSDTPNYFEIVENESSHTKAACVGAPLRR